MQRLGHGAYAAAPGVAVSSARLLHRSAVVSMRATIRSQANSAARWTTTFAWAAAFSVVDPSRAAGVLDAQGPVASAERLILLDATAIMLLIVVPVILATLLVAWWFRASNGRARRMPTWSYSGQLELLVWSIPALVIIFLGGIAWISAHDLDPARPLESNVRPMEIDVVSLDWKWLFIYPEQGVASVNRLVVPVGVPLQFRVTSATVWNVFWIPQLGSMLYCMNGMAGSLILQADHVGRYPGSSAMISGDGFATMNFNADAMPLVDFTNWVRSTHEAGPPLDEQSYRRLLIQQAAVQPYTYRSVAPGLFTAIVTQQLPPGQGPLQGLPAPNVRPLSGG
jgi:cytochrome o ubiquinol oxidase subunit II